MRLFASFRASARTPLLQVLKTSVAAIVAWLVCVVALNQPLPIFAAIAALLVVQPSVNQTLTRGIERSVAVIVGVVIAYLVGLVFGTASWVVLAVIVLTLLLSWALRLAPGSANQIPISAMLVLAIGAQTPGYAVNRVIETIIGAAIGFGINVLIVPPLLARPAHLAIVRLTEDIAETMESLASALRRPTDRAELAALLAQARALRDGQGKVAAALTGAEDSLTLNPRGGRQRALLARDRDLFARLTPLVTRVVGMVRSLHDNAVPGLERDAVVRSIAVELDRAAHDLRLLPRDPREPDLPPVTAELPALTAPLVVTKPDPEHWILVGSLLEDLRRVRQEITGASD